jgi:hypothetical protein
VDVVGMDGDLIVGPHQVDFGEDATTGELVGIILDVPDGIAVWYGAGVEGAVIAAGSPAVVLLGDQVECRGPGTLRRTGGTITNHSIKHGSGD